MLTEVSSPCDNFQDFKSSTLPAEEERASLVNNIFVATVEVLVIAARLHQICMHFSATSQLIRKTFSTIC